MLFVTSKKRIYLRSVVFIKYYLPMTTKNIFLTLLSFIFLFAIVSCGNDDEITYPVTYAYNNNIEFEDFLLFKLNETGQEEIAFTERLAAIEPIVREEVMIGASEDLEFNQITLLSEDQMLFLDENRPTDSFFVDYTQVSSTLLRADLDDSGTEDFELMLTNNNSELRFCNQSTVFFRQPPLNINNGFLEFDFCSFSQPVEEVIDEVRMDNNLVANDTVFYNRSNIIFNRQ